MKKKFVHKNILSKEYSNRFSGNMSSRNMVWSILVKQFFNRFIPLNGRVLDLGCGYGQFINNVESKKRYGMDLNPDSAKYLSEDITFLHQDCCQLWPGYKNFFDVIFSSNFFEHLPTKETLLQTLYNCSFSLKQGGLLICMGPNIKYSKEAYWDFWDHYLPLTDRSLSEVLQIIGLKVITLYPKFLPYTMKKKKMTSLHTLLLKIYLKNPFLWKIFGKQFLIIAQK